MCQGQSRALDSGGSRRCLWFKKGEKLPDIPPDSPLGLMLRYWDSFRSTKHKDKARMIQFCMVKWPKEPLRPHVSWPIFGSTEDWVCQAFNIYVNNRIPVDPEENKYAAAWLGLTELVPVHPVLFTCLSLTP